MIGPEDFVMADEDGIVVIPVNKVDLKEVLAKAKGTNELENRSRAEIRKGHSLEEIFRKHGVL